MQHFQHKSINRQECQGYLMLIITLPTDIKTHYRPIYFNKRNQSDFELCHVRILLLI